MATSDSPKSSILVVGDCFFDRDYGVTASRAEPGRFPDDLDLSADSSRLGGAGVTAELLAAHGHDVTLLTGWPTEHNDRFTELIPLVQPALIGLDRKVPVRRRYLDLGTGEPILQINQENWTEVTSHNFGEWPQLQGIYDAVVVADFGGIARVFTGKVNELINKSSADLTVWDPHWSGTRPTHSVALYAPNLSELSPRFEWPRDIVEISKSSRAIIESGLASQVVVKLGSDGLLYLDHRGIPMWAPTTTVRSCDPTGTGDFATASLVDRMLRSITVSNELYEVNCELTRHLMKYGSARASDEYQLRYRPHLLGSPGYVNEDLKVPIVAAGGCFDLFHPGHLDLLRYGRSLSSRLDVIVSSDSVVRELKGPDRPWLSQDYRREFAESLDNVSHAEIANERVPAEYIESSQPTVWIKGPDYVDKTMPEIEIVRANGGEVLVLLVERIDGTSRQRPPDFTQTIDIRDSSPRTSSTASESNKS